MTTHAIAKLAISLHLAPQPLHDAMQCMLQVILGAVNKGSAFRGSTVPI